MGNERARPKVAIVGRPNVGKSSLFNRLLGKNKAIVHDLPGVTRDIIMGELDLGNVPICLIDTGGYSKERDMLSQEVLGQVVKAISESQVVLFVLDSRTGPLPLDLEIADILRRSRSKVIVCVNKVDNEQMESCLYEFYELGFERVLPISAIHGRGIEALKTQILDALGQTADIEEVQETEVPKVTIVGRPNVGKSSILNRIFGSKRAIVSEIPGTTRDLIDVEVTLGNMNFLFLDTPGMRKRARIAESLEKISVSRAIASIKRSDIALLVLDARSGVVDQDLKIGELIAENHKAAVILINKIDLLRKDRAEEKRLLADVGFKFQFLRYAPILAFSAKTGKGLNALVNTLPRIWDAYNTRVETARLNRALQGFVSSYSLPGSTAHRIKFYYATQVEVRPPTIVLFVNHPELIGPQYERFLKNSLRDVLGLQVSPLKLILRKRQ